LGAIGPGAVLSIKVTNTDNKSTYDAQKFGDAMPPGQTRPVRGWDEKYRPPKPKMEGGEVTRRGAGTIVRCGHTSIGTFKSGFNKIV
jgi:hypothetical protein